MAGENTISEDQEQLEGQILADRFEVVTGPLGWRCRGCEAEVRHDAAMATATIEPGVMVARLAESAADHALFCGRCDD